MRLSIIKKLIEQHIANNVTAALWRENTPVVVDPVATGFTDPWPAMPFDAGETEDSSIIELGSLTDDEATEIILNRQGRYAVSTGTTWPSLDFGMVGIEVNSVDELIFQAFSDVREFGAAYAAMGRSAYFPLQGIFDVPDDLVGSPIRLTIGHEHVGGANLWGALTVTYLGDHNSDGPNSEKFGF